MIMRLKSLKKS